MLQLSKEKESYLTDLAALERRGARGALPWLERLRKGAAARFAELEFPTTKDEDWKYTNVAPIVRTPFRSDVAEASTTIGLEDVGQFKYGAHEWAELVFVNGHYRADLSAVGALPSGVTAGDLTTTLLRQRTEPQHSALSSQPSAADIAERYLGHLAPTDRHTFVALNTGFLQDVAFVHVPDGTAVEGPIHIRFISTAREVETASHPRVLVFVGRTASATVVESYGSLGDSATFSNAVSEIVLDAGASLAHYQLFDEGDRAFHVGTTQVHQERDSVLTSFSVTTGGKLVRNDLNVLLAAEGAECTLNGLYVTSDAQHVDNHTAIDHAHPHGTSRQLYKGILDGRSRAVFNGKVFVRPGAAATDAQQTNRNLILSDAALVNTKPQLEILDDDVKCSHGATIGQLDEEQVFYLRSRGLDDQRARTLLTYGFASEVVNRMKIEPIRVELDRLLLTRLQYEGDIEDLA